jgi:hypothetical protein
MNWFPSFVLLIVRKFIAISSHCEFRDGCEWREAKAEEFATVRAPTPDLA